MRLWRAPTSRRARRTRTALFGHDEGDVALIVKYADVPRWRLREQLAHEKASLGIYLGGHPYQEYADELANFIRVKLADLTPQFVGQSNGSAGGSGHGFRIWLAARRTGGAGRYRGRAAHPANPARTHGDRHAR